MIGSGAFWVFGRFVDITIKTLKNKFCLIIPIFLTMKVHILMHLSSKGLVKIRRAKYLTYQEFASPVSQVLQGTGVVNYVRVFRIFGPISGHVGVAMVFLAAAILNTNLTLCFRNFVKNVEVL